MKLFKSLILALISVVVLAGCASLNQDECLNANWYTLGYVDGANGVNTTKVGDYQSDCAAYGVTPDFEQYQKGHAKGVREFCTPLNGFKQGRRGNEYNGICPQDLKIDYLDALAAGRDHLLALEDVRQAEVNLSRIESQLVYIADEIESKELQLVEDGITRDERIRILDEIKLLQHDIVELETDLAIFAQERLNRLDRLEFLERRDSHLIP